MRVGIVRTDLGRGVYIADLESKSQRSFTHSPEGQARVIRRPTDSDLTAVITPYVAVTPTILANLKAAVYPTLVTINVSQATIIASNAAFGALSGPNQTLLATAIADVVAPSLVETGEVLLSFSLGVLSKLRSAIYRPDGDRVGLPTGVAVAAVENDGVTPFTYP